MASQPDPYAAYADPVPQGAPNPQATPTGMDAEVYRATLEHLVNTGATRDHILAYAQQAGYPEEALRGLDEAITYRDQGGKGHIPVLPTVQQPPQISHAPQQTETDPYAVYADPVQPPHDWKDELGIGARAVGRGLGSVLDLGFLPVEAMLSLSGEKGLGMYADDADSLANSAGLAAPVTNGEKLASKAIEGATGALATGGIGAGIGKLAAGTTAGRVGAALAESPIASALSGGAAGGASEYARQNGAGAGGQLAAGLAGGLGAGGLIAGGGKLADALSTSVDNGTRTLSPVAQAFERQNVPALAADVGGTGTRMATAAANTTLGGIPLREAAEKSIEMARAARDRIAAAIGKPAGDATAAGSAAQSGVKTFLQSSAQKGNQLYEAIPIDGAANAQLSNTKQALSNITAGLKSNPELSAVISDPRMQRIADAIQGKAVQEPTGILDAAGNPIMREVQKGGALSWQDLKDFRSYVGEKAGAQALQSDIPQAKLKALYGALSDDMKATAEAQGPKALAAFNRANSFWRARATRIENVVTPILGKDLAKTPEAAFRQLESWAGDKGSFVRTAQALRTMPADEADTIRATIFNKLGNAHAGAQNGAGEIFSPATFITQWNRLPANAKAVLFPGKQYQQDISDLVTIADAQKAAGKFANTSGTGMAMHMAPGIGTAMALFHNPMALLAAGGAQYSVGKMLANPKFARWLASSVDKPNPAAQLAHINRLTAIATANPVIANDVLALQERLAHAFTGAQPIAAEPAQQEAQP